MLNFLLRAVDFFMPKRWYIKHTEYAQFVFGPVVHELAYFGPFYRWEIDTRLADEYAKLLSYGGDDLEKVKLGWLEARELFIAPRHFWMAQNEGLIDEEETAAWEDED